MERIYQGLRRVLTNSQESEILIAFVNNTDLWIPFEIFINHLKNNLNSGGSLYSFTQSEYLEELRYSVRLDGDVFTVRGDNFATRDYQVISFKFNAGNPNYSGTLEKIKEFLEKFEEGEQLHIMPLSIQNTIKNWPEFEYQLPFKN